MAVGIGYDVHRFAPDRRLVLGGIEFPSDVGLLGHSDADVATHALMDALLGAAALGDIGQHFPPNDARFANANSLDLLRQVVRLLDEHGWRIGNLDLTIVAERPKILPMAGAMRQSLAEAAGITLEQVSVKATTNEGLGFLGRAEGIATLAVAEIFRQPIATGPRPPDRSDDRA